jgi:Fungal specific transcription factor domain
VRCRQYDRLCHFEVVGSQLSPQRRGSTISFGPNAKDLHREEQMKRIICHFLGDISFDTNNLEIIANELEKESGQTEQRTEPRTEPRTQALARTEDHHTTISESYSIDHLSTNTMHYVGEFSHSSFSKILRRRLQSLGDMPEENNASHASDGYRATILQSPSSFIYSATTYLPPRDVADFLVDTFLEFAQTNYYYFDETTFRQNMDHYYRNEQPLTINDAGWICTLLMTFAIGTQFAYMQVKNSPHIQASLDVIPDDNIGLELYRFSCRLIPDLITIASVETVQAFLLLGVYALPIDTSGLAYTYYGLAIKMAIQNGMHRKFPGNDLSHATIELRNRLWWTAYTLER